MLAAYGFRCPISGCDATEALEGAHIVPYSGPETNHPCNGLPLRADLHTLFDLGLLTIDPARMEVVLSPSLRAGQYGVYHGRKLTLPALPELYPNPDCLRKHFDKAQAGWR